MSTLKCTRCDQELATPTWLVLDTRTGTYTDQEVPDEFNQGAFEFGADCAKIALTEHAEAIKNLPCQHMDVTVYSRQIYPATWEEPAEYDHKVVCNQCGEELDIGGIPDGAHETEADWEDDYLED